MGWKCKVMVKMLGGSVSITKHSERSLQSSEPSNGSLRWMHTKVCTYRGQQTWGRVPVNTP